MYENRHNLQSLKRKTKIYLQRVKEIEKGWDNPAIADPK